jgi:D-alanyl-D-alanine endopeptidase (penicillin-binding protein 7)
LDDVDVAYAPLPIHPSPIGESPVAPLPEARLAGVSGENPVQQETVEPQPVAAAESSPPREQPVEQPRAARAAVANAPWLGLVWAVVAAWVVAWAIWTRVRLWRFRRREGLAAGPELIRRATRLACRMGMRRPVVLIEARGLKTPVAFGTLRPTIALPIGFAEDFDRPQQDAMLAHELAHLAARDPLWHFLATLACALLWWHPLAWWSRRRFRAAGEAVADEASLLVPDGPSVLARCLVRLGRRLARPNPVGSLPIEGSGFRSGLGRRVVRLLSLRPDAWRGALPYQSMALKTLLPVGRTQDLVAQFVGHDGTGGPDWARLRLCARR